MKVSQCMIVKNEEGNIRQALGWGKGIVCEQIVVDTGSSDRTVQIAEEMGAKVYHFEWIKDYSAAKNFAIEKAAGDWIAFLDADEYFNPDDAANMQNFLNEIHNDAELKDKYLAVFCPWVHLRDDNSIIRIDRQMRLFRNLPDIRYVGRIHEWLSVDWAYAVMTGDFSIMHTGYTERAYKQTNKAKSNIELIRLEIADKPNDMNFKAYLADSLSADAVYGDYSEAERNAMIDEAKKLYFRVALCDSFVLPNLKKNVYEHVLDDYVLTQEINSDCEKIAEKAIAEFPDDYIIMCCYAGVLNKKGEYRAAFELLNECRQKIESANHALSDPDSAVMIKLSTQMILAAQGLGDTETLIMYAGVRLIAERTNLNILRPYIYTLLKCNPSIDDALDKLGGIYNLNDKSDILLIAKAAKDVGAADLARAIIK